MELIDCSLALEGGAMKGVFTAGALDFFMEKDFYTKYVVGVSAGACCAMDYVAKQKGRSKKCFIPASKKDRYIKKRNLLIGRPIYDMEMVFREFPLNRFPFDFESYYASDIEGEIGVANCLTGKAEYMKASEDRDEFMTIVRASSSMPFLSDLVIIKGIPYIDGGMAESIPLKRAMEKGYKKHIVILTKNEGYRREKNKMSERMAQRKYAQYPKLREMIENRWSVYNKEIEWVEKLEKQGEIFVLRPQIPAISRLEKDLQKANAFYEHGYEYAKERFEDLLEYLNK